MSIADRGEPLRCVLGTNAIHGRGPVQLSAQVWGEVGSGNIIAAPLNTTHVSHDTVDLSMLGCTDHFTDCKLAGTSLQGENDSVADRYPGCERQQLACEAPALMH